jgi:hypothetical protein
MLGNSVANMVYNRWLIVRKLHGDSCKELASMADISTTSREEEARPESLLIIVFARNSACNCRLSCASQTIQPEDAPFVFTISPAAYLLKNVNSGVREASWVIMFDIRVERRFSCVW